MLYFILSKFNLKSNMLSQPVWIAAYSLLFLFWISLCVECWNQGFVAQDSGFFRIINDSTMVETLLIYGKEDKQIFLDVLINKAGTGNLLHSVYKRKDTPLDTYIPLHIIILRRRMR